MTYPNIDPVMFSLGPLHLRWYGLMYVLGFTAAYLLVSWQARRFGWREMGEKLDSLNLAIILGVILGARLGYVCIYNPGYYLAHPLEIPATWSGGMSFHGGCLGVILAALCFCKRNRLDFWRAADLYAATAPIGLFFGRIGNFINGELFGRVSKVPWAMVFPDGGPLPRHPSQLYESLCEGLVLFTILWAVKARPWTKAKAAFWPHGSILALFLLGYGVLRFLLEFTRQPDSQLGLLWARLSMGQWLCLGMILAGMALWCWRLRAVRPEDAQ